MDVRRNNWMSYFYKIIRVFHISLLYVIFESRKMTRVVMMNGDTGSKTSGGNKTRICIKNCPKSWKVSGDVEKFLISSGKMNDWQITDCKLLQRSQMAFVGFRKSDMAEQAVQYFDQTYAITAKLHVSFATNPSNNSNNSHNHKNKRTNNPQKTNNVNKRHALLEKGDINDTNKRDDDKKLEFLATNDRSASFWSNDDGIVRNNEKDDNKMNTSGNENTTKKDLKDFFKSKVTSQDDLSDDDDDDDDGDKKNSNSNNKTTNRLFVRNLPFRATEEELADFFDSSEVHLPLDDSGKNKGFAFVTFSSTAKAQETLQSMNQIDFQGRLLHLLPANPPPPQHTSDNNNHSQEEEHLSFKQKREQERKSNNNEKSWSTSHVSSDAVVTTVASRLQLSKGQVLNVKDTLSSGDAAVRLAMGETHLQEENAIFFQNNQIDLTPNKHRSKTILLVKNLPPISNIEEELTKFFHTSPPEKFIISPSNTVAILHYATSKQAKQAIRKYSFKRFHNIPLYLEYAPMLSNHDTNDNNNNGTLTTNNKDKDSTKTNSEEQTNIVGKEESKSISSSSVVTNTIETKAQAVSVLEEEEEDNNNSKTIYVKNLNFQTTEDDLRKFLEKHDKDILSIRIPTKVGPKSNQQQQQQQLQSMGYGFVECISHNAVQKVLKSLKQKPLQGHYLECQYSQATKSGSTRNSSSTSKKQQKVLMVRNIPFQATKKELMQLFGAYGTLKQVRLPKKFQAHQHRGFAFVEFATPKESQAAKDALAQTHLYGRHLVIEYATENTNNEGINNVSNKKHKVEHSQLPKNKKIRFD